MIISGMDFEEPHNLCFKYIPRGCVRLILKGTARLALPGKAVLKWTVLLQLPFLIDMLDIYRFLGQAAAKTQSSPVLAAFRSDEFPSTLLSFAVATLHKALWSIRLPAPEWKSGYIHCESSPFTQWNWNVPFSSSPTTIRSHRGRREINRSSCCSTTAVAPVARSSKSGGGAAQLSDLCVICLCLPVFTMWWLKQ